MPAHWEVAVRAPSSSLRPYIRGGYTGYTERTEGVSLRREFPGPFVVVVFEFGPPIRISEGGDPRRVSSHRGGFVAGLGDAFAVCEHDGFQQGIQVNLTAIGTRLLFGIPMSEISGRIVPVRDLLPAEHGALVDRLHHLNTWSERFDLLDRTLEALLSEAGEQTRTVAWAMRRIEQTGGALDMRALARELGYSRKHVIAMFRDQVGVPPKQLARIVRFDRLVRHLRGGGGGTWAELALEFGYYDQSHMAREVRYFSGITPTGMRLAAGDASEFTAAV